MSSPQVILYRYDDSPFAHKIDNALLLKGIPHKRVQVAPMLPRPEISGELGINYRRIPLLAIGNDVYCDTSLIVSALERHFPSSKGYGTLFPPAKHGKTTDTGIVKAFSKFYADGALFGAGLPLLPWERLPAPFLKDRGDLMGGSINAKAFAEKRDLAVSQLSSHLTLLEEQLSDGREWLFDTTLPGLADVSTHFIFAWLKGMKTSKAVWDQEKFPHTLKWIERLSALLVAKKRELGDIQTLSGAEAGEIIVSSPPGGDAVGFDKAEGARLRVNLGDKIRVAPTDTGRTYPTTGKLVALNFEEVVIEVQAKKGALNCHFPRFGYVIEVAKAAKL